MDGTRVDVWADTFAQLMAERKPQDIWVLHPQESLVAGHLDGGGLQYQLKGLSRFQCSRCPWTWNSAHVHILFHLWWDKDSGQGLVKMRVWGQQCQLCPPGTLGDCQVSPSDIPVFLGKLVLYILCKCYEDSYGPELYPEAQPGDGCEACDLGVCFLQRAPNPAWGPVLQSTSALEDRQATHSSTTDTNSQQLCAPHRCSPMTVPLLVIDFIEDPFSGSSDFLSEGDCIIVPFSLADVTDISGEGSLLAIGGSRPPMMGQGSIYLFGSSVAIPDGKGILVNVREPIFHDQGLLGSTVKTFELRGFLFGGQDSTPSPIGVAKGQGPITFRNCNVTPGNDLYPVSYTIGLRANGEGVIIFPLSLTNIIRGKGPFEGSVTFPFTFTDTANITTENGRDLVTASHSCPPETNSPISISKGTITIPFSVFRIIRHQGSSHMANGPQSNGFVTYGYYKKRRLRSRFGKSRCGSRREGDFHSSRASRRSRAEASEDFWICVSMTMCIFWLMCMYRLNLGGY
uniref:3CxxC-type domain-containing protein n=1 Tax=Castor canadensis TaxID=51338 RepID=A0A8C0WEV3_CASCN